MRLSIAVATAGCLFSLACTKQATNLSQDQVSPFDVNKYAVNKTVCDPLGGSTAPSSNPQQGLHANLWYLNSTQTQNPYHDVESMITYGQPSDKDLFFSTLDVPTRLFTEGFPLQTGGSITDDSGNELIEYFALRFEGILQLGPDDPEGDYQIGMLSDDGTIWSVASDATGQNYQVALNNDGDHPTQMGCGPILPMTKSTQLNTRIDYYQGPRYHIALVPLWRLVNSSTPTETLCGQNGNSLYFDYTNNSAPEPAYDQLLARGWHPLSPANYAIQTQTQYNPCTQGTPPVISNFTVSLDHAYTVTWTTDIPATDQVLYTDTTTGVQTLTVSDNILRTSHSIELDGLTVGDSYSIQAVSISADLGKTVSSPTSITVP